MYKDYEKIDTFTIPFICLYMNKPVLKNIIILLLLFWFPYKTNQTLL